MEFKPELMDYAIMALSGIATLAFGWLVAWLRGKAKCVFFRRVMDMVKTAVSIAVRHVYQTYVEAIKKARSPESPGGSRLTEQEQLEAMDRASVEAKSLLSWKGLKMVFKAWPGVNAENINAFLRPMIEAEIADQKAEFRALRSGVAASLPLRASIAG